MNDEIIKKYQDGTSATQLAKELNTFPQKIINFLRKKGIKTRDLSESGMKYRIDSDLFEKIDSNEKSYLLGWLFSDGNVYLGSKRYTISITLVESDKQVLDYFNEYLYFPPKKLAYKKEKLKIANNKIYTCKPCYKLQIDNKKMCSDLIALGCVPNKSKTLSFPSYESIPRQYFPSFIRGYFDGDGCALKATKKQKTGISIFSNYDFCIGLQFFLQRELDIKCSVSIGRGCSKVSFGSKDSVLKFYKYIYNDGGFSLQRKKKKIENSLSMVFDNFEPLP